MAVSPYAVAVENIHDIVAAVKFANKHHVKLAIKGAGHDYLGRSNAPGSLLVWTHHMRKVTVQDYFIPQGAPEGTLEIEAVTIEAGARWIDVYNEVINHHHRYVQGGGCTSVGAVGGFLQGGGFGVFSKKYGMAAASLLEAEVVIANGEILIANPYQNSELFWALKGGGGGTFGIISKATLQTYELPQIVGHFQSTITAYTDEDYEKLLECLVPFIGKFLNNEHWGDKITIKPNNVLEISLMFQGLNETEVQEIWHPFYQWLMKRRSVYTYSSHCITVPGHQLWNYNYLTTHYPDFIKSYQEGKNGVFYWASDQSGVLEYWYGMHSCWLLAQLLQKEFSQDLSHTLYQASRCCEISLFLNKGLAGCSPEVSEKSQQTSINPKVLNAAALIVLGSHTQNVYPGHPGFEPSIQEGLKKSQDIAAASKILADFIPDAGSYSNEANYFQQDWQNAFWGSHYPRLLQIKRKYDPQALFQCHHSVGSENYDLVK